jgi:polygalacturonase
MHRPIGMGIVLVLALCATAIAAPRTFTVAEDGSGDFATIQGAVNAIPANSSRHYTIDIKPGIYKERVFLTKDRQHVSFIGDDVARTVITYNLGANDVDPGGKPLGTFNTNTVRIDADDFTAENITFANTKGDMGQALAVSATGDKQIFRNCRMLGWQDTLYANGGRQYYDHCYIEGRVDFIFGSATAVFDHCEIHSRDGGHVTAASTPQDHPFGYVFLDCMLTGEGAQADLGRPWRDYAAVAFIRCTMGAHIKPEGWQNWHDTHRDKTARYSEYQSTGPGANPAARLPWSHQLTDQQASKYTIESIFGIWNPRSPLVARASRPRSPESIYNITDFGATPDGTTNSTQHIQAAINAAGISGGGTVLIPPGNYVTGTLWLRSNVTLDLSPGAMLLGSQNADDFPLWVSHWEGSKVTPRHASLFAGEALDHVTIRGRGTIDGRGAFWWHAPHDGVVKQDLRPFTFRVINSRNVLVDGITVHNSPMWTLTPLACDNVTINNVTIENPANSPNTDGINPECCSNVHISNCSIDVGDDCITIKSGTEDDNRKANLPCQNLTITNCTMLHGHGGVVIGSETSGSVRNVAISNCVFIGTDRGLRFKSRRGRGGVVEDIRVDNIIMDGVLCPFTVNLFYGPGARGEKKVTDQTASFPVDATTPRFRRLRFSNITAKNAKYAAGFIYGLPEMHIDDVSLSNVSIFLDPTNTKSGAPEMAPGLEKFTRAGFFARNVDHLTLHNVDISDQLGPAVTIDNAKSLTLTEVSARTLSETSPLFHLNNTQGAYLRGCSVPAGATSAVQLTGASTRDVRLGDNDFITAHQPIDRGADLSADAVTAGVTRDR